MSGHCEDPGTHFYQVSSLQDLFKTVKAVIKKDVISDILLYRLSRLLWRTFNEVSHSHTLAVKMASDADMELDKHSLTDSRIGVSRTGMSLSCGANLELFSKLKNVTIYGI